MKLNICLGLVVIATMLGTQGTSHLSAARLDSEPVLFTAAPSYLPLAWIVGNERFPAGASIFYKDAKGTRKLFPDFAATADPNVSFDGTKVLFSGKKHDSDPWQIWEGSFNDLEPRQVTNAQDDSIRPFYLPGDRVVYSAKRGGRFVLVNAALDGSEQQQISFAASNVLPSDVLRDGRILLTASYPGQGGSEPEIFSVYSDGSGFESIRCDHKPSRYAGTELDSGDIVFTHGNTLGIFSSPFAVEREVKSPLGQFAGDTAETPTHEWIMSIRSGESSKYELRLFNPNGTVATPYASMPSQNLVQPVIRRVRTIPKKHPSALHDWKFANLMALNVYTSKDPITPGSVTTVRVYGRDNNGAEKALGSAPVEADGSFFVRVPGDLPIKFELVDSKGTIVQREKEWFWARSGEQRICVGCHAGPEHAPENAVPMVLERSTEPVDTTGTLSSQTGGH